MANVADNSNSTLVDWENLSEAPFVFNMKRHVAELVNLMSRNIGYAPDKPFDASEFDSVLEDANEAYLGLFSDQEWDKYHEQLAILLPAEIQKQLDENKLSQEEAFEIFEAYIEQKGYHPRRSNIQNTLLKAHETDATIFLQASESGIDLPFLISCFWDSNNKTGKMLEVARNQIFQTGIEKVNIENYRFDAEKIVLEMFTQDLNLLNKTVPDKPFSIDDFISFAEEAAAFIGWDNYSKDNFIESVASSAKDSIFTNPVNLNRSILLGEINSENAVCEDFFFGMLCLLLKLSQSEANCIRKQILEQEMLTHNKMLRASSDSVFCFYQNDQDEIICLEDIEHGEFMPISGDHLALCAENNPKSIFRSDSVYLFNKLGEPL